MRCYCNESFFIVSKSSALELSAAPLWIWNVLKFDLKKVLEQLELHYFEFKFKYLIFCCEKSESKVVLWNNKLK